MLWRGMRFLPMLLVACSGANQQTSTPVAPGNTPGPNAVVRLLDADWGLVQLDSPALTVELPELSAWRSGNGGSWARIEHPSSGSAIEFWWVRAERRARPADCEARARLARPELWQPAPETTVAQESLDLPATYRTESSVGIEPRDAAGVQGFVIAFGASVSRCYGFYFTTHAEGTGAEIEIARRLDLVSARILPSVTLRNIEDRVSPERPR